MTRTNSIALFFLIFLTCFAESKAAFIQTSISGNLIIEWVSSEAAPAYTEFGLGTPSTNSLLADRDVALIRDGTTLITPISVNMGFYTADSNIDFYMKDEFGGTFWAFTKNLENSPTDSDLVAFRDTDNSLGLGGSVIEVLGVDNWIFHLDGPASICCDDDDNDFVVHAYISPVPLLGSGAFFVSGVLLLLGVVKKRIF